MTRLLSSAATAFVALAVLSLTVPASADPFNGHGEYQTDVYGYYYTITGGKFPTGTTPNGASAGTFSYITDDPAWGIGTDTWHQDGWFADNAGLALTLKNGSASVYDNNGIEDGSYGDYYDQNGSHGSDGLYRGYSMSNNFDFVYASYFKLAATTTITQIIGYFDANGGTADPYAFNPFSPEIGYNMNIWSKVATDLIPVNTNSFNGDVLTTDGTAGSFKVTDTGVVRTFADNSTDPIYRLTYTLAQPMTLAAGEYYFSHDAEIVPLPSVAWAVVAMLGAMGGMTWTRRRVGRI